MVTAKTVLASKKGVGFRMPVCVWQMPGARPGPRLPGSHSAPTGSWDMGHIQMNSEILREGSPLALPLAPSWPKLPFWGWDHVEGAKSCASPNISWWTRFYRETVSQC